jgi:hypothetical protein
LKECERRFNTPNPKQQQAQLRQWAKEFMECLVQPHRNWPKTTMNQIAGGYESLTAKRSLLDT